MTTTSKAPSITEELFFRIDPQLIMDASQQSWPPSSLAQLDLNYCQAVEASPGTPNLDFYVVHMAGLLYHQNWMAARHLFRRSGELDELRPYYEVAMAALKPDLEAVWKLLEALFIRGSNMITESLLSPAILQTYMNEIAQAFRVACFQNFEDPACIPTYFAPLLGFATVEEMTHLARRYRRTEPRDNHPSLQVAAGFLQSRLTADLSLTTTKKATASTGNSEDRKMAATMAASSS